MLRHNLKNATRIIQRHFGFSALNIISLILGLSSCLIIVLYVHYELNYDHFHENKNNIYRVVMHQPGNQVMGSSSEWWVVSPFILKPTWEEELPEIDLVTRMFNWRYTFRYDDQYIEESILSVDPEFFKIFTFPLSLGDENKVFSDLYSIVISKEMSRKYFGEDHPIGKVLELNDGKQFKVTGVLEKIPGNSHLHFDFLISFDTQESMWGRSLLSDNWLHNSYTTFLTLRKNSDLDHFDSKLKKYDVDGFNGKKWTFHLQPLLDIHFNRQIGGTGHKTTVYIFISVAVFILSITCFNFMNLYIAHYRSRTKNISIKKIIGATRSQLVQQFLFESFFLVFISYIFSLTFLWLFIPLFNGFLGQELEFMNLWIPEIFISSLGIVLIVGLLSGVYPALYLSKLHLINAIKGGMEKLSRESRYFRKSMVIIQFSIAIMLVVGTLTVFKQLSFMGNKDLGYQKENIIYLSTEGLYSWENGNMISKIETIKQTLLENSEIIGVSASTGIPSDLKWSNIPVWEGQKDADSPFFYRIVVDADFLNVYGIEIESGRNFSKDLISDVGNAYILNKPAVRRLGFENPIGSKFGFDNTMGTVVGVTKDFHFESLHKPITPLGIGFSDKRYFNFLSIRFRSNDVSSTIKNIEQIWKSFASRSPFKYAFLDDHLNMLYLKDQKLSESLNYFSLMALFITSLGIFGLVSFSLKERTKEIGIRKVLGAPFLSLLKNLTKEIIIILWVASFIGGIFGWYISKIWLNNFAYKFHLAPDILVFSVLLTFLITFIPISFKLVKSVRSNPAKTLRIE